MNIRLNIATSLLFLSCSACGGGAASIHRDGFELEADAWKEAEAEIGRRAAFDLGCSREKLALVVLAAHDDAGADMPKAIGVAGCGKQATYVRPFAVAGGSAFGGGRAVEGTWQMDAAGIRGE